MRILLVFLLFSLSFISFGQEKDVEIVVNLKDDDSGKKLSGATVSVYANGTFVTSSTSGGNGKVPTIYVETGKYYQIFIRKEGYVTKMAELDARIDILEDAPDPLYVNFQTAIFESVEGVDFSFLETTPMTKFYFDSEYYRVFDKDYTDKMLKRIAELKREIEEKKKEEDKKEEEERKTQADFQAYVDAGDKAVKDVNYQTAVEQFGLALQLRKDDADVKAKLENAKKLLEEENQKAEKQKMYQAKMVEATNAYKSEKLEDAINLYTEASALLPAEQDPKDKIAEIRQKIAAKKALDEKIDALVTAGDIAASTEDYDEAIAKYTEALGLRDSEEVKKKLDDVKKKKADAASKAEAEKLKLEQYNALLNSGKELFDSKKYEEAKAKFTEASTLMPDESLPKASIAEIDKILEAQKAKEEKLAAYQTKMTEAKTAADNADYDAAISLYNAAKEILPLEPEPPAKISEINALKAAEQAKKDEYKKLLVEGDQFASTEEYESAIDLYEKAGAIDNTDEVADKIKAALAAMQAISDAKKLARELEAKYTALIEKADKERDGDQLVEAIASYNEAQELKKAESYPTEEVTKINKILQERKAAEAAKAEEEAAYQAIIDAGDKLFNSGEWQNSKSKFEEALSVKAEDAYPKEKIAEIDTKLAKIASEQAENEAYDAAMDAGKAAFEAKTYDQAIAEYTKAKNLKEEESEPQQRIDDINKILADLKNASEKEAAYVDALELGNELREAKEYSKAKSAYETALSLKENDPIATAEIDKIDKILEKLANEKAEEEQFASLVSQADVLFSNNDFEKAKAKYNEAIAIRTDNDVSKKIELTNEKLKAMEDMAIKKKELDLLITEADKLIEAESWNEAISKYEAANQIEKTDYNVAQIKLAKDRIALQEQSALEEQKFKTLLTEAKDFEAAKNLQKSLDTYKAAYTIKPDAAVAESIKKVELAIESAKNEKLAVKAYETKIAEANAAFGSSKYKEAISLYKEAKVLKGDDTYSDAQIKLCEEAIAKLSEKENIEKYNSTVAKADQLFSKQDYDEAIAEYEIAQGIANGKTYPTEKIAEIKKIRLAAAAAEAEKNKKETDYKNLVLLADEKLGAKNYEEAISTYRKAQKLKSFDNYVESKIKEAEEKLTVLNAEKAAIQKYQSFIDKADELMRKEEWKLAIADYRNAIVYNQSETYPKDQIELAEKAIENDSKEMSESAYQELLNDAQAKMDSKDYEASLTLYKSAYRQRPVDNIPADKIRELNGLIAAATASASAENKYKTLISKADNLFEKKEWKQARAFYKSAYNMTNDSYPDSQIKKIDAINNKFAGDQYSKMIKKADEYFADENYEKAKGLYNRAIKTFTTQNISYPKAQIKKINAILNPPALLAGGTAKPVGEKVYLSESEIQKMFQEAGEASKNKEVTKVLTASSSAKNVINDWSASETNASYQAVDSLEIQKLSIVNQQNLAENKRKNEETKVAAVSQNVVEQQTYESEYGQNVSYRQMQVVENIAKTTALKESVRDDVRRDFVPEVQQMTEEHTTVKNAQNGSQNNMLFTQVNQLETMAVEMTNSFTNADVARANTELDVTNAEINIANAENTNMWEHEDVRFSTVVATENMDAEQFSATEYSDVPRQNMEKMVSQSERGFSGSQRKSNDRNIDVISQTNDAVVALKENISTAVKEADAGREHMEKINTRMSENLQQATISQANLNQVQVELTDESIAKLKDNQYKTYQNKTDKLYEDTKTINQNVDDIVKQQVTDLSTADNNMYITTDKLANVDTRLSDDGLQADENAENNADIIQLQQKVVAKEQIDNKQANEDLLNLTEDKILSLRDIDVKSITQAVKNELGNKYPEGVTEEVYQQKDEDGYLLSYVVRRVVVKAGEGNVYEKTQMKFGTSYTKNGVAISEYTWQDQTEDASLTYH